MKEWVLYGTGTAVYRIAVVGGFEAATNFTTDAHSYVPTGPKVKAALECHFSYAFRLFSRG